MMALAVSTHVVVMGSGEILFVSLFAGIMFGRNREDYWTSFLFNYPVAQMLSTRFPMSLGSTSFHGHGHPNRFQGINIMLVGIISFSSTILWKLHAGLARIVHLALLLLKGRRQKRNAREGGDQQLRASKDAIEEFKRYRSRSAGQDEADKAG